MPIIDIQPIEINGGHYVAISMSGRELRRHGPYADSTAAKATVDRLVRRWLATSPIDVTTNDALINNHDFITDLCRYSESIYTETDVRKKWRLTDEDWERAGNDDALVRAIEDEKIRRVRNGTHAREKAQQVFVKVPDVLDEILSDKNASPRHRIESSRELRAIANVGPEAQPTADRYVIQINLGADYKLRFDKSITPVANDKDVEIIEQKLLPMSEEDNGGQPV
jgi:hypothetical protein